MYKAGLIKRLKSSEGLFSIMTVSIGNTVGTLISAVAIIIISRVLGPADFGSFSASFALLMIVVKVLDFGINTATERTLSKLPVASQQMTSYTTTAFYLKVVFSQILTGIGLVLSPYLAQFFGLNDIRLVYLAVILSFSTMLYDFAMILLQSTREFLTVARLTISQALAKLILGIILWSQAILNPITALLVYGLMPVVGALAIWPKLPKISFKLTSTWRPELKVLLEVTRWTAVGMIAAVLVDNLDILFIQKYLGSYETGLYSAASRIAAFASIIAWSIGTVLSNRVAQYGLRQHLDLYLKKAPLIALGGALLVLLFIPLSRIGIILTVGPSYVDATFPLILLLISVAVTTLTVPYTSLFYLFNKPQYYAIVGLILLFGTIFGNLVAIPLYGITGAGVVKIILRLIVLIFTVSYAYITYRRYPKT